MKRKFLIVLLAVVCIACLAFAVAACVDTSDKNGGNNENTGNGGNNGGQGNIDPDNLMGHVWSEWEIVTPATCDDAGKKTRSCTNEWCKGKQVRSIDPLGHDWDEWGVSIEAGCETDGEETRVCKRDFHHTETRKIDMLGHDITDEFPSFFKHNGLCSRCQNNISANHIFNTDNVCTDCGFELIPSAGLEYKKVNYISNVEYSVAIGTFTGTTVHIPNYYNGYPVTTIGSFAFSRDENLKNVFIPENVTDINSFAFSGCDNLKSIFISENNPNYASLDGILYNKEKTEIIAVPSALSGNITLSDNLSEIKRRAFSGCTYLESVIIPDSIAYINDSAFYRCTNLKRVTMGNGVIEMGDSVFEWCYALEQINLSNKLTKVGSWAFDSCDIKSLVIPASVTSIGVQAFAFCDKLTRLTFENPNGWWYSSDKDATQGTAIPASDLSASTTAAKEMTDLWSYGGKYLRRSDN